MSFDVFSCKYLVKNETLESINSNHINTIYQRAYDVCDIQGCSMVMFAPFMDIEQMNVSRPIRWATDRYSARGSYRFHDRVLFFA